MVRYYLGNGKNLTQGKKYLIECAECGDFLITDDLGNDRRISSSFFTGVKTISSSRSGVKKVNKTQGTFLYWLKSLFKKNKYKK